MQNEILLVAEAVSSEKGLPKEAIFEAIEQALATATKKRYQESSNIEVVIDPQTGEYETFRLWEIVSDDDFRNKEQSMVSRRNFPPIYMRTQQHTSYINLNSYISYFAEHNIW